MIKFKLIDENDFDKEYIIELNFVNSEDFDNWTSETSQFDDFMLEMEATEAEWSGVHDASGGVDEDNIEYISFYSYEIRDFTSAIDKWKVFFQNNNKLIN